MESGQRWKAGESIAESFLNLRFTGTIQKQEPMKMAVSQSSLTLCLFASRISFQDYNIMMCVFFLVCFAVFVSEEWNEIKKAIDNFNE